MSTSVATPVRVNSPPPDDGERISPACAFLAMMTPAKGARTRWRSTNSVCRWTATSATLTSACADA